MLLDALSGKQEEYQDLFSDNRITFSEAIAKLYQRINPHIDMGQRTAQTIGEELLDYRNYLELEVEVFRGADGWRKAAEFAVKTSCHVVYFSWMRLRVWMVNPFLPCSNFANVWICNYLSLHRRISALKKGQPINWCVKSPATKNKFMWLVCVALAQQSSFLKRSKQLAAFLL